jgi:hypothetical protein
MGIVHNHHSMKACRGNRREAAFTYLNKVNVKFALEQIMNAHRESRGIALRFC